MTNITAVTSAKEYRQLKEDIGDSFTARQKQIEAPEYDGEVRVAETKTTTNAKEDIDNKKYLELLRENAKEDIDSEEFL